MLRAIAITIALGHVALFLALGGAHRGDRPGDFSVVLAVRRRRRSGFSLPTGGTRTRSMTPPTPWHCALQNSPFLESVSSDADKLLRTRDPSAVCVLKNVWACVFDALQNTPKQSCQCDKSAQKLYFSLLPPLETSTPSQIYLFNAARALLGRHASSPSQPPSRDTPSRTDCPLRLNCLNAVEARVRGLRIRREAARGRSVLAGLEH